MKRLFFTSCVFVICVISSAQKVTIDKITYLIENNEACVYETDIDIVTANILSSVDYKGKSYPVTKIGHYNKYLQVRRKGCAFMKCENLTSVSIPNSVLSISSYAFSYCSKLTSITLPYSITSIGSCAFAFSCLQEISIPNSVKTIGLAAFYGVPLIQLIVPDSPIEIYKGKKMGQPYDSFYGCKRITEVRCQNGSYPTYMIPHLPEDCPFILASRYPQSNNNNNIYAQNVQQTPVQNNSDIVTEQTKKPSSDVDVNIPSNVPNNENTFAVILANENYQEEEK